MSKILDKTQVVYFLNHIAIYFGVHFFIRTQCMSTQVGQLSQRHRAAGWISYGQKSKTGTSRQYLRTLFTDHIQSL